MSFLKDDLLKKVMKNRFKQQPFKDRKRIFAGRFPVSFKVKKTRLTDKSFVSLLPNLTTLLGLCFGLTAVRFAMNGNYEYAVIVVLIAAIFDSMDGRIARYFNSTSLLGAELDSFSDLVTFGVAPAMVLYYKALHQYDRIGWMIVLFYVCCMALRLARFNVVNQEDDLPDWHSQFFTGTPAPMCAFLSFCPLMFTFSCNPFYKLPTYFYAFILVFVALLAVSRIPTFSMKTITVQRKYILPILLIGILVFGALVSYPWVTISLGGFVGYLALIPFSIKHHKKLNPGSS